MHGVAGAVVEDGFQVSAARKEQDPSRGGRVCGARKEEAEWLYLRIRRE